MLVLFIVFAIVHRASAMCYDEQIQTSDISVSASSDPVSASQLADDPGWCTNSKDINPYLQLGFPDTYNFCRIKVFKPPKEQDRWVRSYFINASFDGITWTTHQEDGKNRVFIGTFGKGGSGNSYFYENLFARFIRIIPVTWYNRPCMSVLVYGTRFHSVNDARNKTVKSTSALNTGMTSYVTDGNGSTCIMTKTIYNPMVSVDLGKPLQLIRDIRIKAGAGSGLGGGFNVFVDNKMCGSFKVQPHQTIIVECFPLLSGRYVRIVVTRYANIALCEVEVTLRDNWATRAAKAELSNIDSNWTANYAFNGNPEQCATTLRDVSPYASWLYLEWDKSRGSRVLNFQEIYLRMPVSSGEYGFYLNKRYNKILSYVGRIIRIINFVKYGFYPTYDVLPSTAPLLLRRETSGVLKVCELEIYGLNSPCDSSSLGVKTYLEYSIHRSASSGNAKNVRLFGSSAWVPDDNDTRPYVQINLMYKSFVCAIVTQGNPSKDQWTTSYKVAVSLDNVNYTEVDGGKIFTGNNDRNGIVKNIFGTSYLTNFVRVYPMTKYGNYSLRLELYGTPQGVGKIKKITKALYSVKQACQSNMSLIHLQISSSDYYEGLAIQGSSNSDRWVTSFSIQYKKFRPITGEEWLDYKEDGVKTTVFPGNWDRNSVRYITFKRISYFKGIRIVPITWHGDKWCMRAEGRKIPAQGYYLERLSLDFRRSIPQFPGYVNASCRSVGTVNIEHEWYLDGTWTVKNISENKIVGPISHKDVVETTINKYYATCGDLLVDYNCSIPTLPQTKISCTRKQEIACRARTITKIPEESYIYGPEPSFNLNLPHSPVNGTVTNMRSYSSFHFRFDIRESDIPDSEYIVNITNTSTTTTYKLTPPNKEITFTGIQPLNNYTVTVTAKNCFGQGVTYTKNVYTDIVRLFWEKQEITSREGATPPCLKIRSDTGKTDDGANCTVRMNAITAEPGKDFTASPIQVTIPPGGGGKTVCAPILDDNEVEGANETFSMSLHCENENISTKVTNSVVTVTIVDDDVSIDWELTEMSVKENTGCVKLPTLKRQGYSAMPLTISVQTIDATAASGNEYKDLQQNVTFQPDEYEKRNISVCLVDDNTVEGKKAFKVAITSYHSQVIINNAHLMVTIIDNDQVEFDFVKSNVTLQEEVGFTTVCVRKNGSNEVPVNVSLISGKNSDKWTAESGKDFSDKLHGKQLMFGPNTNQICLNLTIINDGAVESDEVFSFELQCPDASKCVLGSRKLHVITIKDEFDVAENERLLREQEEKKKTTIFYLLAVAVGIAALLLLLLVISLVIFCVGV